MELKPGYKQSDVGVIPEDWDAPTLGALGEALIGLTYKPSDVREFGTLVLRSSNIQNNALVFDDNVFVDVAVPSRAFTRPGDVLICARNGSRDLIGKSVYLDQRVEGMAFGAFMAVHRGPYGKYVSLLFQSEILKRQINEHLGATINQITNKSLNSFLVPFPREETEQSTIATALSDIDALLAAQAALIEKKRAIKKGAMQELVTGKRRLPGFSEEWELKRFGDIAPLQRGFDLPTSTLRPGDYPVVYSNGVLNSHSSYLVEGPGVVTGRSGTIGNVTYVDGRYWPHNTALWVTSFKGNDPRFVFYLYQHVGLERFATGSGVPTLNRNDVHAFKVLIPPTKEEQTHIAGLLLDMDTEISSLEAKRKKIAQLKQGMMQELLTGKIRLA